jgi:hypothetical protein
VDQGIIRFVKHKYCRSLDCRFLQRTTATKECYRGSSFDAISMLAASWNVVSQGTIASCHQKARFCETSEPYSEPDDVSQWEDVQEKLNVTTFTFEKYGEVDDDSPLPCTFQEIDDVYTEYKKTETDDEGDKAAVCKSIPKYSETMFYLDTYHHSIVVFLTCKSLSSETAGNWKTLIHVRLKDK